MVTITEAPKFSSRKGGVRRKSSSEKKSDGWGGAKPVIISRVKDGVKEVRDSSGRFVPEKQVSIRL